MCSYLTESKLKMCARLIMRAFHFVVPVCACRGQCDKVVAVTLTFSDTQGPFALRDTQGPIAPHTLTSLDVCSRTEQHSLQRGTDEPGKSSAASSWLSGSYLDLKCGRKRHFERSLDIFGENPLEGLFEQRRVEGVGHHHVSSDQTEKTF